MKIQLKCLECALHSFLDLLENFNIDAKTSENLTREFLKYLSKLDYNISPPEIAKYIHQKIKIYINNPDPYKDKKHFFNKKIIDEYDKFYNIIKNSNNPFITALKLCISGNIIDFGPNIPLAMEDTIKNAINKNFAIDNTKELLSDLKKAKKILYLTDNAGEIVFDKLFIQILLEKNIINKNKIIVATRGFPILNDATLEDAHQIGLQNLVKLIHNGDSTPGTILQTTSKEFQKIFNESDLIISKGQGNFETLNEIENKLIYFLFITKCPIIAKHIGVPLNSFICMRHFS